MEVNYIGPSDWVLGENNNTVAFVGDYKIPARGLIGQGGNAYVYKAEVFFNDEKEKISKDVVLKIYKDPMVNHDMIFFMRQERLAHRELSMHPSCSEYVTCLYEIFLTDYRKSKHPTFVLEHMSGDVHDLIINIRDKVNELELLGFIFYIVLSMLNQVRFIHSRGLNHGDVKPGNELFKLKGLEINVNNLILKMSDLGAACNPVRVPCGTNYGATELFATPAYNRMSKHEVIEPPNDLLRNNDFFGCMLSIPVLMNVARLIELDYSHGKMQDVYIQSMKKYKNTYGIPLKSVYKNVEEMQTKSFTETMYNNVKSAYEGISSIISNLAPGWKNMNEPAPPMEPVMSEENLMDELNRMLAETEPPLVEQSMVKSSAKRRKSRKRKSHSKRKSQPKKRYYPKRK